MNLTEHFTLEEMTQSYYAESRMIDNSANQQIVANLTELCLVLEQIRAALGRPITVKSGYRNPRVNAGVGGSKTSSHMQGRAADITVKGMTSNEVAVKIASHMKDFGIDQVIEEFGDWVHVGIADIPRHQALTAKKIDGKTIYFQGIV